MIIWSIATTTFGDAIRKKVLQVFLVVAIGLIIMSLSFSQTLSFSTREGFSSDILYLKSFGLGLMAVAGLFISLVLGTSLIPQEIERRTIYTILAKPVKRYEFIIGKFLGAVLTLAVCIGLMGLVFVLTTVIKAAGAQETVTSAAAQMAGDLPSASVTEVQIFDVNSVLGVIMIFLQFLVLSSVVLLFSVFLTPTVNFFMGAAVYLIGVMAPVTESLSKAENAAGWLKAIYRVIHAVIPNFDKFNVTNPILHPATLAQGANLNTYTAEVALYSVLYALAAMTLAVIIFERKEV